MTFGIIILGILLYIISTIILPNILRLLIARTIVTRL